MPLALLKKFVELCLNYARFSELCTSLTYYMPTVTSTESLPSLADMSVCKWSDLS